MIYFRSAVEVGKAASKEWEALPAAEQFKWEGEAEGDAESLTKKKADDKTERGDDADDDDDEEMHV
jgi:hypothetical protein